MQSTKPAPSNRDPGTIERASLERFMATLYNGGASSGGSFDSSRKSRISGLSDEVQLFMLGDEGIRSARDRYGIGPVHDFALFGGAAVQLRIFEEREFFNSDMFQSPWGTPIDLLALYGCQEVKKMMLELPKVELMAARRNGGTLLHGLAKGMDREGRLMLLELSPDMLGAKDRNGRSVIREIHDCGDKAVEERVYGRFPLWNRM